jgi:hypothetical protein
VRLLHEILELIYFLSGPAIAVFAWKGLTQLKITREIAKTSAKRESYRLAADRVTYYHERVIPLQNALDFTCKSKGISLFDKTKLEKVGSRFRIIYAEGYNPISDIHTVAPDLSAAFNAMEAFAVFFMSGIADEQVAFGSVGKTFLNSVSKYLPVLLFLSDGEYYKNIINLYVLWNERSERMTLLKSKDSIEERLKKVNERGIDPIGT